MILLYILALYLSLGVIVALLFVTKWIYKVDKTTLDAQSNFKIMIFPACVALWPILIKKYTEAIKAND